MKQLPGKLTPSNIENFKEYRYNRELCKLRMLVYEFMLTDEFITRKNKVFDLQESNISFLPKEYLEKLINELNVLGWNAKLTYSNTSISILKNGETHSDIKCSLIEE